MTFSILPAQYHNITYFGNSLNDYAVAVAALVVFVIVFKIFQSIIIGRLKHLARKTKTDLDDTAIRVVNSFRPPFYSFVAAFLALQFLALPAVANRAVTIILILWVVYQAIIAVQILIDYAVKKRAGDEEEARGAVHFLSILAKVVLWSIGLLFVLSNLGVNVTSLVAGLGIGGIAIAFALQNILSDLFSSFALVFDKPFVVGDFIVVGDKSGVVEKIGIKTTRIRSLQGEELVISNRRLTSETVQNFKKMRERRIVFSVGVAYETPTNKLEKIPELVKEIIDAVPKTRFDRAHFNRFDESTLNIEIVYYVETGNYSDFMNANQAIHLGMKRAFEKEKIVIAYPTRTLYIEK